MAAWEAEFGLRRFERARQAFAPMIGGPMHGRRATLDRPTIVAPASDPKPLRFDESPPPVATFTELRYDRMLVAPNFAAQPVYVFVCTSLYDDDEALLEVRLALFEAPLGDLPVTDSRDPR